VTDLGGGDAQRDTVAAAAEVEPQHQPRLLDGAAAMPRAQAKAAVKTVDRDVLALDVVKQRVPDQRAVTEYPQIFRRFPAGEDAVERTVEFLLGNKRQTREVCIAVFPQDVVLEIFAGQHILKTF
jgi:hypothetical protein